jgi:hypothetical protein
MSFETLLKKYRRAITSAAEDVVNVLFILPEIIPIENDYIKVYPGLPESYKSNSKESNLGEDINKEIN